MLINVSANTENGEIRGDIGGVSTDTVAEKVWLSSQAIGDIAFAFTYNVILLDIQVRNSPSCELDPQCYNPL